MKNYLKKMSILKFKKKNKKYFIDSPFKIETYIQMFHKYYETLIDLNYINIKIKIKSPDYISKNIDNIVLIETHFNALIQILNKIELAESSYLVIDKDLKNVSLILSIRPLVPKENHNQVIRNIYSFFTNLPHKINIVSILNLGNKVNFYFDKIINNDIEYHYFNIYSKQNKDTDYIYTLLLEAITNLDNFGKAIDIKHELNRYEIFTTYNLTKINEYYVFYIWKIYLKMNNLFLYFDNDILFIYEKYSESSYSFFKKYHSNFLISNYDEVLKYIYLKFPLQFTSVNIKDKTFIYLEKAYNLLLNNINDNFVYFRINKNIIEFKNGIYLIDKNLFLLNAKINEYSSLYINENFNLNFYINNEFLNNLILDIKFCFKNSLFINRKKNLNFFFLKIGEIINNLLIFNNQLYISNKRLYIINELQELIENIIKSRYYTKILDKIAPFFILMKLYQINFNNTALFDKSVELYNKETFTNKRYGIYHPEITKYHKDNLFIFFFSINNYYLKNVGLGNSEIVVSEEIKINEIIKKQNF